jgi:hypothetical protein
VQGTDGATYANGVEATNLELAQAFTAAVNAQDVDSLVDLFTEEDAGPTVTADRFAWQKFEIRLWAQKAADMNIQVVAQQYRLTEQGAVWDADEYRDDWAAIGMRVLRVTNSICVHNGKIASFASTPSNPIDADQLGNLWQPGASPERTSS